MEDDEINQRGVRKVDIEWKRLRSLNVSFDLRRRATSVEPQPGKGKESISPALTDRSGVDQVAFFLKVCGDLA